MSSPRQPNGVFCCGCKQVAKAADTVKVDPAQVILENQDAQRKETEKKSEEAKLQLAFDERQRQEKLAQEKAEEARIQDEAHRRQEEERARQRQEEEERRVEEARLLKEQAEAVRKQEVDKRKLDEWLAKSNFRDAHVQKSGLLWSMYPLHQAVLDVDPDMVRILIANDADVYAHNSSKQTPYQLAEKLSKNAAGRYDGVMASLRGR
eukprot:CAMPEP_0194520224 /NCGR_PEP_ID=MMETSP0253-20130528/54122_1 /TAXON_ID=2966 /ORGANISM="Noctiluca scintillans" /LENGTH=206 /DNA_ID=CAMNT_0039364435 /DNA_START=23 /DNA_END=643 /DNA_ORIENTATION=+